MNSASVDRPLIFEPILKRILWGGRRLGSLLGKQLGPEQDYAESWEIADHAHGRSVVAWPPRWAGKTLGELVAQAPRDILGNRVDPGRPNQFPLLIKFLDAHQVLSLQVHPNDELARKLVDDNGKNEAWVVLHADPGSRIYAGLKPGVTREAFKVAMAAGNVADLVHDFEPRPGDCIMIPAGTVHAIGAGIVLAEIQQMSDATFRVDDWGRLGPDGRPRTLHLDEALEATDFSRGPVGPLVPERVPTDAIETVHEKLAQCDYFTIERWTTEGTLRAGDPGKARFTILIVVAGDASIRCEDDVDTSVKAGASVLIPAAAGQISVKSVGTEPLVVLECTTP